jgi:integrase
LRKIRPAAFGVTSKTFANLRSLLAAALQLAGVFDTLARGRARQHPAWAPLLREIGSDKRLANGLAGFANWCAKNDLRPDAVTDEAVQQFLIWLETRTHHPRPRDLVRRIPCLWNEARARIEGWPNAQLTLLSFRRPRRRLSWNELSEGFRHDAEAYLVMREKPDLFDDTSNAPHRPLAPTTLRLQCEHLRLAASILIESGIDSAKIASLADLIQPERVKTVLRHYHGQANGKPSAFAIALAKTLIQIAQYHVRTSPDLVSQLKRLAAKLPPVPFDLTAKNKALLRQLESDNLRAKLMFLPDDLLQGMAKAVETSALSLVKAQVAIAVDILLAVPLRPENLTDLNWQRHFHEPDGPKRRLLLHIPSEETKARVQDLTVEIPDDVGRRIRWYRRCILPRANADPNGFLFVTKAGVRKSQETLSQQITETIATHVGIHMTPHQFRHFCAASYLEDHPEDFETARAMLNHRSSKTTLVYAGASDRRASRVYGKYLFEQRDKLKLSRTRIKTGAKPLKKNASG